MTQNAGNTSGRRPGALLATLFVLAAMFVLAVPASALAAPVLQVDSSHIPASSQVPAGSYARYTLKVSNTGTTDTTALTTVDFSVPSGLEIVAVDDEINQSFGPGANVWDCTIAGGAQSVSCDGVDPFGLLGGPLPIEAGKEACQEAFGGFIPHCRIIVTLKADENATPGIVHPALTACGGGVTVCPAIAATAPDDPVEIVPNEFALTSLEGDVLDESSIPETQAGSHPHTAFSDFTLSAALDPNGDEWPVEDFKDAITKLPPGVVGNPQAVPPCTQQQLAGSTIFCPIASQIGFVQLTFTEGGVAVGSGKAPVFNMQTGPGTPALFAFNYVGTLVQIYAKVRTGEDYGATVIAKNAAQTLSIKGVKFTVWGVPANPGNDADRACFPQSSVMESGDWGCSSPEAAAPKPFFTLPTSCTGPVETFLEVTSWYGSSANSSFVTEPGGTGCPAVPFSPSVQARPTTNIADAASGLDVDIEVPQDNGACDPGPPVSCGIATAHLKDTTVALPEGLVINPSGANGLDGCSLAEFGLTSGIGATPIHTTPDAATCPDAAKLATVEIDSPLVDHLLKGSAYIADPYQNPFGSFLALYITLDDPQTGIVVKLAGEVKADPNTGQLTATFKDNPQLPFESFKLHFKGGSHGTLRTPATCGTHTTGATLVPWSATGGAPSKDLTDPWTISQGPGGGACAKSTAEQPHAPSMDAGTVSPIAGAYSPMVVHLRREDGSQNFSEVTVTPPPGLVGKLAGIPACPDSALEAAAGKSGQEEKANPSCPAASRVGTVDVAAGAGPAPYWVQGIAYLAGPYKGAPISLAIVTPATAGPFDVGTVVVRTALYVDPKTAQITAKADPLPSILQGIPLDIRQALIRLDRSQFTLTGTSCNPMAFTGSLVSTLGQTASLSSRFQLAECTDLGLKPKLTLRLKGGTKRRAHPGLTATLEPRAGDANLRSVSVALPPTELLDNAHIGTVCTRVQFAADQCPADSVYGTATVTTPLLDYPLSGNVYLRSSDNPLPDLVPDFRGPASQPIRLESAGRTDTVKGALRNTFDLIPDAPFTKLVLSLPAGRKGLIQNSTDICAKKYKATVKYTAQNGLSLEQRPVVKAQCPKKRKKQRKRAHRHAVR